MASSCASAASLTWISSGGDFTPDGGFAGPVQVSFLFDGERLIDKLPEFTVSSPGLCTFEAWMALIDLRW